MLDPFVTEQRVNNSQHLKRATRRQILDRDSKIAFAKNHHNEAVKVAILDFCEELMKRPKSEINNNQLELLREYNFIL